MSKDLDNDVFCGYRVNEAIEYGLIKAIILNQVRWYIRTLGRKFDGVKCYRSVKELAEDIGLPYGTVKQNLPTEEMGIKKTSGYIPGTLTKTTWWELVPKKAVFGLSEMTADSKSKELLSDSKSYNKEENIKENKSDLPTANHPQDPFSVSVNKNEKVVDLKAVNKSTPKVGGSFVAALLGASGKKGAITAALINQVRVQVNRYGEDVLMDVAKRSKFDEFASTLSLGQLMSQNVIESMLNKDNKPEDILSLPKTDPRRIEYMRKHPELQL